MSRDFLQSGIGMTLPFWSLNSGFIGKRSAARSLWRSQICFVTLYSDLKLRLQRGHSTVNVGILGKCGAHPMCNRGAL